MHPGAYRKETVENLFLRDNKEAQTPETTVEHLGWKGLLAIAKRLARESATIRSLPGDRDLIRACRTAQPWKKRRMKINRKRTVRGVWTKHRRNPWKSLYIFLTKCLRFLFLFFSNIRLVRSTEIRNANSRKRSVVVFRGTSPTQYRTFCCRANSSIKRV